MKPGGSEMVGWRVIQGPDCIPHVVPKDDHKPHDPAPTCWCKPTDDEGVMVHHALDRREHFEETRPQ